MEISYVVTALQAAGILLVATLLGLLTRAISNRFLLYWAGGWATLVVALTALNVAFHIDSLNFVFPSRVTHWMARSLFVCYCAGGYVAGFLFWAGCRDFAKATPLARRDLTLLIPPMLIGSLVAALYPNIDVVFPFHALLVAGFHFIALWSTIGVRPVGFPMRLGLRLLQCGLAGLALLFLHYAIVMGWRLGQDPMPEYEYLHYSAAYDVLVEFVIAFGMVMLATDNVRRELEAKNRLLADALAELDRIAHTDALTGLHNRRAYEAFLKDPAAPGPAGSVAVIDLNDLKPINDRHGHETGDAAIQVVARVVRGNTRLTDRVYRLGGDEFLVVMPAGVGAELTSRLTEIDGLLAAVRLPGIEGTTRLSIAWGVAEYGAETAFAAAVRAADAAMYARKAARKRGQ